MTLPLDKEYRIRYPLRRQLVRYDLPGSTYVRLSGHGCFVLVPHAVVHGIRLLLVLVVLQSIPLFFSLRSCVLVIDRQRVSSFRLSAADPTQVRSGVHDARWVQLFSLDTHDLMLTAAVLSKPRASWTDMKYYCQLRELTGTVSMLPSVPPLDLATQASFFGAVDVPRTGPQGTTTRVPFARAGHIPDQYICCSELGSAVHDTCTAHQSQPTCLGLDALYGAVSSRVIQ